MAKVPKSFKSVSYCSKSCFETVCLVIYSASRRVTAGTEDELGDWGLKVFYVHFMCKFIFGIGIVLMEVWFQWFYTEHWSLPWVWFVKNYISVSLIMWGYNTFLLYRSSGEDVFSGFTGFVSLWSLMYPNENVICVFKWKVSTSYGWNAITIVIDAHILTQDGL